MIVCINTNTLVQATADSHPYHTILIAWVAGQFTWAVSTSILEEYQEIHERMNRSRRWRKFLLLMDITELTDGNILKVNPHYQVHIVSNDLDDNKFTDCGKSANQDGLADDAFDFTSTARRNNRLSTTSQSRVLMVCLLV